LPRCPGVNHTVCEYIRRLLDVGVYWQWVQHTLVQAEYWHDPLNEKLYHQHSFYLADVNNENSVNEQYKARMQTLERFVLVKFLNDTFVQPPDSSWFAFYKPGQDKIVQPLRESDIYLQDRLGLQELDKQGKLHFLATPGEHLQFTLQWFIDNIVPFLKQ